MGIAGNERRTPVETFDESLKSEGVIFGQIDNVADRVLILGAGPSLQRVDRALLLKVAASIRTIVVNAAVEAVVRPSDWFTLDFDQRTRALASRCRPPTRVIAAVPDDFGTPNARVIMHRCDAPKNVLYLRRLAGDGPWSSKFGLSDDPGTIHTGNSAYGALGVAWLMKAKFILLLGVDGTQLPGWPGRHPPRGLNHLNELFGSAVPQLDAAKVSVINGNPESKVRCFATMPSKKALEWIGGR